MSDKVATPEGAISDTTTFNFDFDWANLAFESKKPLSSLKATFIAAPREMSVARFTQLLKEYLPLGNIILGISKEAYVDGFEDQPQFKMLSKDTVQSLIDKVNASSKHKIYTLSYLQRELAFILEKISVARALFVNGSWQYSFHTLPVYYALVNKKVPYQLVSAFASEDEARAYEKATSKEVQKNITEQINDDQDLSKKYLTDQAAMRLSDLVAQGSYDHTFQTGAVLARKTKDGYVSIATAFNKVLPYQTYAIHNGASRETHFSPPNDLNHYDTIHAEMVLLTQALKQGISLKGTTLFVNLMPCPNCARVIAETELDEVVYRIDHSEGYAVNLLTKVGKNIRRIVY